MSLHSICLINIITLPIRIVLVAWFAWSFPATAQEQGASITEQSAFTEQPGPTEAGQAIAEIEALTALFQDDAIVIDLRTRLESAEQQLSTEISGRFSAIPLERIDRRGLEGILRTLARQASTLSILQQELSETIADIDRIHVSLRQTESIWSEAQQTIEQGNRPQEVLGLIERVIIDAARGRELAGNRLGELVVIEARAIQLRSRIDSLTSEAETRERTLLADIFRLDGEPLWMSSAQLFPGDVIGAMDVLTEDQRYGLRDLADTYGNRLLGQGIMGFLLLAFLLFVRRSRIIDSELEDTAVQRVLKHPIATTVVLTLAFTQPLYPTAQPSVVALNTSIFIVAELIVLRAVLAWPGWRTLLILAAYLIATQVTDSLAFGAPLHRLAMLFCAVGGIVVFGVTWRIGDAKAGFGRWRQIVALVFLLFVILLVTAAFANVVGSVTYSSFVVDAVVRCYLAALGLLTLSLVVRDLVVASLYTELLGALRSIRQSKDSMAPPLKKAIAAIAVFLWLWAALNAFRVLEPFLRAVESILAASWSIGQATISLGTVIVFVVSIWLAVYVSRMARFFLNEDVLPRLDLPRGVPAAISATTHYLIIASAVLFGTAAAGIDFTRIAIVVGALSVGIGFGLQNIVNNFISGLILLFERPIQVGDHVQVGALMGRVARIGIRASTVRTYEGSEVIVPNGDLISQQVVNHTLSDRDRRLEVLVGVAYGTDLEKALDVIEDAVSGVPLVSSTFPSQVLFLGFGESSLDFRVLFWIDDFEVGLKARSEVGIAINRALARDGIEIPFPQRDLHIREAIPQPGHDADSQTRAG